MKRKLTICDWWYEDTIMGMDIEECRKNGRRCTCSGVTEQCDYPERKCKHYGENLQACGRIDIRPVCCNGKIRDCEFEEKQEVKVDEKKKSVDQVDAVTARIEELTKSHGAKGLQIDALKNSIQQLAKERISIQGGIIELKKMILADGYKKQK